MAHEEIRRCTILRRSGAFCDGDPVPFAPFPICSKHLSRAFLFVRDWTNEALGPKPVDRAKAERRAEQRAAAASQQSLVYYVRELPGQIKIGYTTNMKERLLGLRLPVENVLATEPGGRELEAKRHQQFKALRIGRRESFVDDPELLSHIDMIRAHFGPPRITTYVRS